VVDPAFAPQSIALKTLEISSTAPLNYLETIYTPAP